MKNILFLAALTGLVCGVARAETLSGDAAFASGDYGEAYREWAQAASEGDASAMAAVGVLYDTGHGVQQDFGLALQWYRRAAELGNVRAMFNVGAMYDNGRGTPVDRPEALHWFERAAQQGYARAAYVAGLILRDGDGVPRDRVAAIRYFRLAALGGIEAAQFKLAALNAGPPRSPPAAPDAGHPRRAAALGLNQVDLAQLQKAMLTRTPLDSPAANALARLAPSFAEKAPAGTRIDQYDAGYVLENGFGLPRDPVRSYVYYLRATASPDDNVKAAALRGAADVARTLSPAQHQAARDMLLEGGR